MIRVRIEEVQEGMTLAKPVEDGAGGVLARSGTVLTVPVLARMIELGVEEVFILPPPASDADRQKQLAEVEARWKRMFAGTEDDPLMRELARSALDVLRRKV